MVRLLQVSGAVCLWALFVPTALGQTVQLPSFQRFSVNTSVLAPDRGGAYLGGVRRSALGSSRYGTPGAGKVPGLGRLTGNRAVGGSTSGGGVSAHVTVIDHEALDRAVLEDARRRRGRRATATPQVAELSRRLSSSAQSTASRSGDLLSVAEIRRQNAQRSEAQQREAMRLATQGKQAAEQGSLGAAKIFYQMAYRRADAELQQHIGARLKELQ